MNIAFEFSATRITIKVEDDESAKRLFHEAFEVISKTISPSDPAYTSLKETYDSWGEQLAEHDSILMDRLLWDAVLETASVEGVCRVQTTFGARLLARINLI